MQVKLSFHNLLTLKNRLNESPFAFLNPSILLQGLVQDL